jgi:hypothetical protein
MVSPEEGFRSAILCFSIMMTMEKLLANIGDFTHVKPMSKIYVTVSPSAFLRLKYYFLFPVFKISGPLFFLYRSSLAPSI